MKKTKRYFAFVGDISPFKRYLHYISHAEVYARQFHRRNIKICAKNATIYSILTKTVRYIRPVGDISTIKRYFCCILNAECYTLRFQRRDKPNCAQNATIFSILTKTVRYIGPVGDISTFRRYFHCILHAECYTRRFQRRDNQTCMKNVTTYSILTTN